MKIRVSLESVCGSAKFRAHCWWKGQPHKQPHAVRWRIRRLVYKTEGRSTLFKRHQYVAPSRAPSSPT